jgi:cytochrome c-type biogenesis protein CcmF
MEFYRGAKAERRMRKTSRAGAFLRLFSRNRRRYGGYVIHFGVVLLVAGVALHTAYRTEYRASLKPGETARVGSYSVTLMKVREEVTASKLATVATLAVRTATGRNLGRISTERSLQANQDQPTTEVGIRSTPLEDLYVIMESVDASRSLVAFRFLVNPAVFWIWAGSAALIAGGVIVAWPERSRRRKRKSTAHSRESTHPHGAEPESLLQEPGLRGGDQT